MGIDQLYAKSSRPGEDEGSSFRLEIGRDDGVEPRPIDVIYMAVRILEELVVDTELAKTPEEARAYLKEAIDSKYTIKVFTPEYKKKN